VNRSQRVASLLEENDKKTNSDLTCPLCGETDFDKVVLKIHIINGWCDEFENTKVPERYKQ
jgi:hypothetical protein